MSDVGLFLLLFAALAIVLVVIRLLAWLTDFFEAGGVRAALQRSADRYVSVNHSERDIMSREQTAPIIGALSSKDGQLPGRTDSLTHGRAELLTLYKILREYGVPREKIRGALKGVNVPLSNDVWAAAAPPEDEHITPIAGRTTRAQFDADYPYEPLN